MNIDKTKREHVDIYLPKARRNNGVIVSNAELQVLKAYAVEGYNLRQSFFFKKMKILVALANE